MGLERRWVWLTVVLMWVAGCEGSEEPRRGAEHAPAGRSEQALASVPTPLLVRDIWPGNLSSNPSSMVNVNGTLFFAADDGVGGKELWKSDGTAAGTVLVKDIRPGSWGSDPAYLTNVNGTLFFAADATGWGPELWKSDGTTAGTVLVKSVSYPSNFTLVNKTLFFTASDSTNGNELWKSDGTTAGTVLVKNIRSGSQGSNPTSLTVLNGQLVFVANDGVNGEELWRSDGTAFGTVLVRNIEPDVNAGGPKHLLVMNGVLYFNARADAYPPLGYELWKSDGTTSGTVLLKDVLPGNLSSYPQWLTLSSGRFFFVGANSSDVKELWKSDGTAAGTVRFTDLPLATGFSSTPLFDYQGSLYFVVDEGTQRALWRTQGTAEGVVRVKTFAPGTTAMRDLTVSGGKLFFYLQGAVTTHPTLWVSDGTEAGTRPVGAVSLPFAQGTLRDVGGTLFAAASGTEPHGFELWKSDGTDTGTTLVKNIRTTPGTAAPMYLAAVGDRVFFAADDGLRGHELWTSDGTEAGTVFLKDIHTQDPTDWYDSSPMGFTAKDGMVFFSAAAMDTGRELWKTDGTAAGTTLVRNIYTSSSGSNPQYLTVLNGTLLFTANDGSVGVELWKSDGTTAGTVRVKDIQPGYYGSDPSSLTLFNGALWFSANDGTNGYALWKSDGTTAGTMLVKSFSTFSPLANFTPVGSTLFFSLSTSTSGTELWKSDGTSAGTVLVKDIRTGSGGSEPGTLVAINGTLFFTADNGTQGRELWKSDGTSAGTVLVKDIAAGSAGSSPASLVNVGGTLFFAANDGVSGLELWRSDGTEAGTWRVRDISPGATGAAVTRLVEVDGVLYFAANDGTTGTELWRSDGTEAGTTLVADLAPGSAASSPEQLTRVGTTLYFVADDGQHGRELWRLVFSTDETPPAVTCPAAISAEATGTVGAKVEYPPATATDAHTVTPVVTYSHASGAVFPLGTTEVIATATDQAGNSATCAFRVTVRDTTAPALTCPSDVTVNAQDTEGATVTYPPASASDAVSSPAVTYSQGSGTRFDVGTTAVTVTARDGAGNIATCSFKVIVQLPPEPSVTCPADTVAEATSSTGALVSYPSATASGTAPVVLGYSRASGSQFPLATTPVSVTATDALGRTASCTFTVTVRDTTAPSLTCPSDVTVDAQDTEGATVTYPPASTSDAVSSPAVTYSQGSGTRFGVGTTVVTVTARDGAGNTATCSFKVIVQLPPEPSVTCPAETVAEATSSTGALVSYPSATASGTAPVVLGYSHASGSQFPLATTPVTVTATDALGRTASCTFTVTVRDTTPPDVGCPGPLTVEAQSSTGADAVFSLAAPRDAVTSSPTVSSSHAPGSRFPLGSTEVRVSATDEAGNTGTCDFLVLVRDTTSPALVCPADVAVTAQSDQGQGTAVTYVPASVSDTVSPVVLASSHPSGSLFAPGTTSVTLTATDAVGNASSCVFRVNVDVRPSVVEPPAPPEPPASPEPLGCGCSADASAPLGLWWGALMLLAVASSRRRLGRLH
jgi:MYXO-CTERM domain-containing protein